MFFFFRNKRDLVYRVFVWDYRKYRIQRVGYEYPGVYGMKTVKLTDTG